MTSKKKNSLYHFLYLDVNLVKDRYGSSDATFPFSNFLWVCSDIFARYVLINKI